MCLTFSTFLSLLKLFEKVFKEYHLSSKQNGSKFVCTGYEQMTHVGNEKSTAYEVSLGVRKPVFDVGAQWLSRRVLDSRPRGRKFEPHRRHCVVVLEQDTLFLA